MKKFLNQKGATLVETLIAAVIIGIASTGILQINKLATKNDVLIKDQIEIMEFSEQLRTELDTGKVCNSTLDNFNSSWRNNLDLSSPIELESLITSQHSITGNEEVIIRAGEKLSEKSNLIVESITLTPGKNFEQNTNDSPGLAYLKLIVTVKGKNKLSTRKRITQDIPIIGNINNKRVTGDIDCQGTNLDLIGSVANSVMNQHLNRYAQNNLPSNFSPRYDAQSGKYILTIEGYEYSIYDYSNLIYQVLTNTFDEARENLSEEESNSSSSTNSSGVNI